MIGDLKRTLSFLCALLRSKRVRFTDRAVATAIVHDDDHRRMMRAPFASLQIEIMVTQNSTNVGLSVEFHVLRGPHPDFGGFSRDILTMLGTLLASIMSFYFGSRAVETGAAAVRNLSAPARQAPPPTIASRTVSFEAPNVVRHGDKGLGIFHVGDRIRLTGGANDGKTFTVDTVGAGEIKTVQTTIQTAPAGQDITIARV